MGEAVPVFGMLSGVLVTFAAVWGVVKLTQGPLGQAVARRLQGRAARDPELSGEVAELREQVAILRQQLEETQERVDFAERLLSQRGQVGAIPGTTERQQ